MIIPKWESGEIVTQFQDFLSTKVILNKVRYDFRNGTRLWNANLMNGSFTIVEEPTGAFVDSGDAESRIDNDKL